MYPEYDIQIVWHDDLSGSIINNNMISGKYQIGFMGDMPCLINGYNSETNDDYNAVCIAIDGRGKMGKNQDILVGINSGITKIEDLEGKTISTPIGSSAHRMLLNILDIYNLQGKVNVVHQDINIAYSLLQTQKIDAFAVWAPYGKYLEYENVAKTLIEGEESKVDYLTGIIINKDWLDDNKEICRLFLESIEEAHQQIVKSPKTAAEIFEKETGFPYEVCLEMANSIKWEMQIKKEDLITFEKDLEFLANMNIIEFYDYKKFFYNFDY